MIYSLFKAVFCSQNRFSVDIQKFRSSKQKILCDSEKKQFCLGLVSLKFQTDGKPNDMRCSFVNFGNWEEMEKKKEEIHMKGFCKKLGKNITATMGFGTYEQNEPSTAEMGW